MTVPETKDQEITTSVDATTNDRLQELTSQSWNLELIISGAALFATLNLPDLLDTGLTYYRYNLMPDTDYIHEIVPTMVLGLIKGVSYLLFTAFLVHFIMRAFWVGLVGLLAVYPEGIDYSTIHTLSHYARKRFAEEMGTLPDYILRLDRRYNIIFALAFGLVLLLMGVAVAYALFILAEAILQMLVPAYLYDTVRAVVTWFFVISFGGLGITIAVLNLPSLRDNPRLAPFAFQLSKLLSLLFLGFYRPLSYIMYTFQSRLPKQLLTRRLVWIVSVLLLAEFVFMILQFFQTMGGSDLLDQRAFITMRAPTYVANANAYDNLRAPDQLITEASIQADVIREPYIRLFVSYPKSLDAELTKRFQEPQWPANLSRRERRERRAAWYVQAFETYFGVYLNDSLYRSPGYLFTQRSDNQQSGLTTVLLADNLKPGRNTLRIAVPDTSRNPKPYCLIPFWYVPEK